MFYASPASQKTQLFLPPRISDNTASEAFKSANCGLSWEGGYIASLWSQDAVRSLLDFWRWVNYDWYEGIFEKKWIRRKMGKFGIAFFTLLALLLLWKCIFLPLWVDFAKKDAAIILLLIVLFALLHLFGSGFIELMKSIGLEKLAER